MGLLLEDLAHLVLLALAIVMGVLTVEAEELLYAAMSFLGMCVALGILYWLLHAPYVAVFQLAIYAGALVVLFVSVIMLTRRE
ncbi:hypothetical protein DRO56_00080 [Candidatus Bathyarchaeota archaeon]|nr:MAG: NADH-quinone oxidoreductase subunit J [Candidatus Bathyarchaeota archaeon]RLI34086.1 MAG: hypothetical protein DRO56_00080 [Candidatus Bathyarchaeota archaeon]